MKKINESLERIALMRKGQQLKCPKCENGYFAAVGDSATTKVFKCSHCPAKIIFTVPWKEGDKNG